MTAQVYAKDFFFVGQNRLFVIFFQIRHTNLKFFFFIFAGNVE